MIVTNEMRLRFRNWDFIAWVGERSEDAMIAIRPMVEAIGLDWKSQYAKLKANPRFSCGDITTAGADGKQYVMVCLPAKQIGVWLNSINALKVKPGIRETLMQFQEDCMWAIYDGITGKADPARIAAMERTIEEMKGQISILLNTIGEMQRRDEIEVSHAGRLLSNSRRRNLHLVNN